MGKLMATDLLFHDRLLAVLDVARQLLRALRLSPEAATECSFSV